MAVVLQWVKGAGLSRKVDSLEAGFGNGLMEIATHLMHLFVRVNCNF